MASDMHSAGAAVELKDNTVIVVLGASGDLAKKKTYRNQFLPKDIRIVGYARTKMDRDEYIKRVRSYIKTPTKDIEQQLDEFCNICTYVSGQYDRDESFLQLNKHLEELEQGRKETHRLFYMALPPSVFTIVSQHLKKCCYPTNGIARVIVEKPFGKDLASSRELQKSLEPDWKEDEIYRIDHYLGKEMVKNILILRFGNSFLGATWNRHHIDNVQITFKEPFGTEGRGGYFDEFGIIRDVMQNHLLQVLTLLAMERPISFSAEDIRDEKVRVLRAIPAIEPKNVIIGQYGKSLDGSKPSYKEDDTVPKDSRCPTFCALVAYIKNERWDGVPFIMKAGKALNEQKTEIRVQFKDVTSGIFKDIPRNELVMRIQPNESVYIKMNSKLPGLTMQTVVTELDLTYRRRFSDLKIPEAYESLILDCIKGDHSNFVRDDELDASWRIFTPLLHYLDDNKEIIPMEYPYGSRGPAVLDDFTSSYGYKFSDAAGYQWPTTSAAGPGNKFPMEDDLHHITTDIMPLGLLLTRLAEFSQAKLQEHIMELASKPLPQVLANGIANGTTNGVANVHNAPTEDTSSESLEKKTMLLNFIKDLHSRWVKALVITEWARNADEVGKLIDIRSHLAEKLQLYQKTFWTLVQVKREVAFARVQSPDLKTALEILSNGEVHWMPDFGYLEEPLAAKDKLHWIHEIEIHLHVRLQLDEYDKMPEPFKQYTVDNGRVTFAVPGEFEVDLTIASDDSSKQFWFLDYRPLYSPAPSEVPDDARLFLERQVNNALAADGLMGCYRYLHEYTLTAKIAEFRRQALELSRTGLWIDNLKIERLDRGLAIQYWLNCQHSRPSQSWILLGVHGGKGSDGLQDSPSHLMLSWFRDDKEVKDADIRFDVDNISTEKLLMTVISRHIEDLLSPIYRTLLAKRRYAGKHGRLALDLKGEPQDFRLVMQLAGEVDATVRVSPWTGDFLFSPHYAAVSEVQRRFRTLANPAKDGPNVLEQLRWSYTVYHLRSLPRHVDWSVLRASPVPSDEVKNMVYQQSPPPREAFYAVWVRHTKWDPHWFAMLSLSLAGDSWMLVEISPEIKGSLSRRILTFSQLPISPVDLLHSDILFQKLYTFGPSIIGQTRSLLNLHQERTVHAAREPVGAGSCSWPSQIHLPMITVRASDMLHGWTSADDADRTRWAAGFIPIMYKGPAPPLPGDSSSRILVEANVAVSDRAKFEFLDRKLDRDVHYDRHTGRFTLRFRPEIGSGVIPLLRARMQALERLLDFVDAIHRAGKQVATERVTLGEIMFTYGGSTAVALPPSQLLPNQPEQRLWKVRLDLSREQGVDVVLEKDNPHFRVIDFLRATANSAQAKGIPTWLALTLPLFRALERLQDVWDPVYANGRGAGCWILHKSLDWVTLRFTFGPPKGRRLQLDIKAREREGKLMWHVSRPLTDINAHNENDEFNQILAQRVWSVNGDGFKGLMTGAAADWEHGIENLLALISDTVLSMVGTSPPPQLQPQHGLP
ncbi:glucose-6-phosphate dehydrogenase [Achaetomium macrosporum]|uniref:Glucose-6-phosphate 1-dehydrogenase n=1 Tax=Achaetomium macrosporum TaxID=79813 RepID=A0AAN7CDZ2_9PEZI|nr:glucose-6-phosphate dehydrogenase [Achaetomium macrosporum]